MGYLRESLLWDKVSPGAIFAELTSMQSNIRLNTVTPLIVDMEEDMTDHQRNVRQTLEGNERVWFHSKKDLLAVWHGGPQITIVSSRTFEEQAVLNVKSHDRTLSEIEDAVTVKLAQRGFDRVGRTQDNTRVVKA